MNERIWDHYLRIFGRVLCGEIAARSRLLEARGGACDEIFDPQTPGLQHHQYHRSALKKHVGVMRFLSSGAAKSMHSFLMVVFLNGGA